MIEKFQCPRCCGKGSYIDRDEGYLPLTDSISGYVGYEYLHIQSGQIVRYYEVPDKVYKCPSCEDGWICCETNIAKG